MLDLKEGDRLLASFPITPGSQRLPAPVGTWKIVKVTILPNFRWDEAMLQHGRRSGNYYMIPPGPRNLVGIVWIGLNKKGISIHGTDKSGYNRAFRQSRVHQAGELGRDSAGW